MPQEPVRLQRGGRPRARDAAKAERTEQDGGKLKYKADNVCAKPSEIRASSVANPS